jgi:long-chain acyl-CoA synthetase
MQRNWGNFYERFAATAHRFADRTAVEQVRREGIESVTYGELQKQAEATAGFLIARDIQPGDRCAILADNDIAWCASYLGILRVGAIAVPLDTHYAPQQIAKLLQDSGAKIIFTTERYAASVAEASRLAGASVKLSLLRGSYPGFESLSQLESTSGGALPGGVVTLNDAAVILYTSGTTSDPKGVVLTHGNLLAEAEAVFARLQLNENDSILGVMPLYHSLAQLANLLLPFLVGARVVYLEEISASEMLSALRERRPTLFCCVPQFFYLIHQRVLGNVAKAGRMRSLLFRLLLRTNSMLRRFAGVNLGHIFFSPVHEVIGKRMRILVTGGARFDPAIGRDFYKLGFNLYEAYGLTETAGAATLTPPGEGGQGTVGIALPGIDVKIVPAERGNLDDELSGEIAVRGPTVMKGYFHRMEATAEVLMDGWFMTGDLGRLDGQGRLHITGRKKEVIVLSSGKNIYPEEIEAQYAKSPFIQEVCVVGLALPGEPAAERLHAVIVPNLEVMKERKVVNIKEVLRFDIENASVLLPAHKRILSYEIQVEPLPRTTTRKLKRFEIERQVRERGSHATEDKATSQPVKEEEAKWALDPGVVRVLELIREAAHDKYAVRAEANLELDLGLDSIERVELLTNVEHVFGTRMTPEVAQSIYTVRQLVDATLLKSATPGPAAEHASAWSKLLSELPGDEPLFADLLKPYRIVTIAGFGVLKLANLLARLLLRFRVTGLENLPRDRTYLICPNHETYIDPFFLASAMPYRVFRQLFYVGASEYFATPLRRKAARWMHVAPVDPDANLVRALQAGAFGIRHGKILVLFPEGERSIDGEVRKFKKGAAILSAHLQVPIVPAAFNGVFPIWPRNRGLSWRAFLPWSGTRVRLHFGAPIPPADFRENEGVTGAAETHYTTMTEGLRRTVIELQAGLRDKS